MKQSKTRKVTKIILKTLLYSGALIIVATSPSPLLARRLFPELLKVARRKMNGKKQSEITDMQYKNAFYYLKKNGLMHMEYKKGQLYISLTEEGKEKAKKYNIDSLEIKKTKKWDKKWHILIFDISDKHKIKREALRGKIKELGLYQLQKSVWACPYEFFKEADILRGFFGLNKNEIQIITATKIENDHNMRTFFNLKS